MKHIFWKNIFLPTFPFSFQNITENNFFRPIKPSPGWFLVLQIYFAAKMLVRSKKNYKILGPEASVYKK